MMRDDRQPAVDQILKAIEYGLLPVDEIERRLQKIISEELSCPIDAEYDEEKVEFCYSLLQQIYQEKRIDAREYAEKIKAKIVERHRTYKLRKKVLAGGLRSTAAALIIFIVLSFLNIIPPIKWFSGRPSDDNEQYIVAGHEINGKTAIATVLKHDNVESFQTANLEEFESFLGFETGLPKLLGEIYIPVTYHASIFPTWFDIECSYSNENRQSIVYNAAVYENLNDAWLPFEQEDGSGKYFLFNGKIIYTFRNIHIVSYVWFSDNVVYSLDYDISIDNSKEITEKLLEQWY